MTFNSVEYAGFLFCVALLYWVSHPRVRPWILLIASLAFYATWNWRFVPLLLFSTVVSYAAALALPKAVGARRTLLLVASVGSCAGIVVFFKTVNVLAGGSGAGGGIGIGATTALESVVIPVGLSFYSFQVISYVLDVKRGDMEPERSFVLYALYVAFFPHLLAGPIVRARRLIPQLTNKRRRPDPVMLSEGLQLLFLGLFKKVAVADVLLANLQSYLPGVASHDPRVGTPMTLLAQLIVLLANFFDISGYVDMARGSAKVLGVRMPGSFAQPFTRSRNWTEFWRRWQITIMGWFRDYVYRPVRGNARSERRETIALFATFLAAGLWHGLSIGWLIWGTLTASILVIERRTGFARRRDRRTTSKVVMVRRQLVRSVYLYVCLFATTPWAGTKSIDEALAVYRYLFTGGWGQIDLNMVVFAIYAIVVLILTDNFERRSMDREGFSDPINLTRAAAFGCMFVALLVFSGATQQQFVYFQF